MKRLTIIAIIIIIAATARAQHKHESRPLILPGTGRLDVEQMNRHIDTGMDISHLTLSELRVLRNAFAARQGYPFMSAELRSIFSCTSWYDDVYWNRHERWNDDNYDGPRDTADYRHNYMLVDALTPLQYTKEETAFIKRLKAREDELQKQNFTTAGKSRRVNTDNIINPFQLTGMSDSLREALARNGFAIVPANYQQMFHIYERNDYHEFPNFVTTDIFLQLYHLYFDCLLREVEQQRLYDVTADFCAAMQSALAERMAGTRKGAVHDAAEYGAAYFAIARALITGEKPQGLTGRYGLMVSDEVKRVMAAEDECSDFLGYLTVQFSYSLFRPRGHYTRNDTLGRYFRTMMWLQSVPFGTDDDSRMKAAMVMADVIGGDGRINRMYRRLTEPITFLMGAPDNVTVMQLYDEMKDSGKPLDLLLKSRKDMARVRTRVEAVGERQTRIRPKFERTSRCKINLMPQRYMPDAEVLQEMIDWKSTVSLRETPAGLDVMAAMRWSAAERILIDEMGEAGRWSGYAPALERMKARMDSIDWSETMATRWIESLTALKDTTHDMPYFMLSPQWQKKSLNAALASWAELKHDAILYAKQPMAAECGGGGPPQPVTKGYVEPNVRYWKAAIGLLDATKKVLDDNGLTTAKARDITGRLREEAEFLLRISEKELAGKRLLNEEYDQIKLLGARYEYISLELLREPGQYLQFWDDVQGTDKHIAIVADVYTANGDNTPPDRKGVLYGGVGAADEIYVVVEIDGYLYLTRGAVFSYRELKRPLGELRLTDGEWQQMLKTEPGLGRPEWMREIIVPEENMPEDNERVFYSSGC